MDTSLNIIVVEDNDDLRQATVEALQAMGHVVQGADCAEALDDELGAFRADLLVLDLNLPGEDGISVAQRIRSAEPDIGIIMLTARNQLRDKMRGYESGADIYLAKPTSVDELGAAIAALARRIRPRVAATQALTLNMVTLQLRGPLGLCDVSDQEATLLSAFAKARDHRLEHWQLIELSGKTADDASKNAMEVQIVRLRKRLEQAGAAAPTIKAIRGTGYQLCVAVEIG
jgi:DNA-binding response OmpR family regulator